MIQTHKDDKKAEAGSAERATLYSRGGLGLGYTKLEIKRIEWRRGQYAQYDNAIRLTWRQPRQRKDRRKWLTGKPEAVIVAGWNNPDPPSSYEIVTDDPQATMSRGRFSSFDPAWAADFDQWFDKAGLTVLADFRQKNTGDQGSISLTELAERGRAERAAEAERIAEVQPPTEAADPGFSFTEIEPGTDERIAEVQAIAQAAEPETEAAYSDMLIDPEADPLGDYSSGDLLGDYLDLAPHFDQGDEDLTEIRTVLTGRGFLFVDLPHPTEAEAQADADQRLDALQDKIDAMTTPTAETEPEADDLGPVDSAGGWIRRWGDFYNDNQRRNAEAADAGPNGSGAGVDLWGKATQAAKLEAADAEPETHAGELLRLELKAAELDATTPADRPSEDHAKGYTTDDPDQFEYVPEPDPVMPAGQAEWIDGKTVGKMIRPRLRSIFPGVTFYVRTDHNKLSVYWLDGPTQAEVQKIAGQYDGGGFDGMIDLGYSIYHWLMPDGSTRIAYSSGTAGSGGSVSAFGGDGSKPDPGARLVSFHTEYISCKRTHSAEFLQRAGEQISSEYGWAMPEIGDNQTWISHSKTLDGASFVHDPINFPAPDDHWRAGGSNYARALGEVFNHAAHDISYYEPPQTKPETAKNKPGRAAGGASVDYHPDQAVITYAERRSAVWTFIETVKPPADIRAALKGIGFFWWRKRGKWANKQEIAEVTIRAILEGGSGSSGDGDGGGAGDPPSSSPSKAKPTAKAEPGTEPDPAKAEKLIALAGSFDKAIKKKRDTFKGANLTHRRQRFIDSANYDADRMQEAQKILIDLADLWTLGLVPAHLVKVGTKKTALQLTENIRSRAQYGDKYPSSYNDRVWGSWGDYNAAHAWADTLISGVDHSERDAERAIQRLEQKAKFAKISGFFPTPPAVAASMLQHVQLWEGDLVLEPSAGSGALCDMIAEYFPRATLHAVEVSHMLREILTLKGHQIIEHDIYDLDSIGKYDAIIMNPPFEKMQDADHVRYCYAMLKSGGTLVSVMSPSPFHNSTKAAQDFRSWFDTFGGEKFDLPADSFKESGTGVNAVYIVISKE